MNAETKGEQYKMKKIIQSVILFAAAFSLASCSAAIEKPQQSDTSYEVTESSISAEASSESEEAAETDISAAETTEPIRTDLKSVDDILSYLSTEQKIGQLLLARCPEENAEEIMEKYQLGGYTFYASDFQDETPESMLEKIENIQSKTIVSAFMAVDEEGGTVVRVSKFPQYRLSPFDSQIALARGGEELIESETAEKAVLLASIGLNFNLAPVADVTENHQDYIFDRTFGVSAEKTGEYVALTVETMNENNMGSCLKHFPGYGSNEDTHTGIAIDDRSAESFEQTDLVPFRYGIEAGAPAIMVSHNIVNAFDSERPASLSSAVHEILRTELGFEGVILTDDLSMDAISLYTDDESPYVLAIEAGNDLLCISDIETAYNDLLEAVSSGIIEEERIDESVRRILEMKADLGIISFGE